MVLLESEMDERIKLTYEEYVIDAQREYIAKYDGENGLTQWFDFMMSRLHRIRKRLGGVRMKKTTELITEGHRLQLESGDPSYHKNWIELLLRDYYDPMYDYQIEKGGRKIEFKGVYADVLEYLKTLEKDHL